MMPLTNHRRRSSGSTVRPESRAKNEKDIRLDVPEVTTPIQASLWIHDDSFSIEQVVLNESILAGSGIQEGSLVEISTSPDEIEVRDFDAESSDTDPGQKGQRLPNGNERSRLSQSCLCIARLAPPEMVSKQQNLEVSMTRTLANAFNFAPRSRVLLNLADLNKCTASHVEICFRDAYLSRSDMWRFASQELIGKTVYTGQKVTFVGSLKATIKNVHLRGQRAPTAYFSGTTVPVFRSEAARYVIFIQMSRGMWDFYSDGSGDIMFSRVVNGFLPDLFKRWSELEVRHLVSIVMFGRLEYNRSEIDQRHRGGSISRTSISSELLPLDFQDFYRVVVTDMASAQWTTILDELKRDFRVFLRDMSLFSAPAPHPEDVLLEDPKPAPTKITGRLSTALKGNILEAINLAASQFSNDYVDRDLIRTGVSTIVVTAGTGVFDVDRDLLKLTSENLTNNGIGIDIVCLSRMPLHSVPLLRYRLPESTPGRDLHSGQASTSPSELSSSLNHPFLPNLSQSPAFSSVTNTSTNYFARFPGAFPLKVAQPFGYGIPQWIDLSYWTPERETQRLMDFGVKSGKTKRRRYKKNSFIPRVRMYELQMMGIMEMGMADIAIPYLAELEMVTKSQHKAFQSSHAPTRYNRSLSQSPEILRRVPLSQRRSPEVLPLEMSHSTVARRMLDGMDRYDENLFHFHESHGVQSNAGRKSKHKHRKPRHDFENRIEGSKQLATRDDEKPQLDIRTLAKGIESGSDTASVSSSHTQPRKNPRISRNISYALRGLAPLKPTAATAEVNVENVSAQLLPKNTPVIGTDSDASIANTNSEPPNLTHPRRRLDEDKYTASETKFSEGERSSKPISITTSGKASNPNSSSAAPGRTRRSNLNHRHFGDLNDATTSGEDMSNSSADEKESACSVPESKIPFLRNVNASNPLKHKHAANSFGRWQHLYPRKPQAATVKWRSLCTPASVPLTTEEFPSFSELAAAYDSVSHTISVQTKDELRENPENPLNSLLLELISLRLAHGYQFVVGAAVAKVAGKGLCDSESLFSPSDLSERGDTIFLSMGNTIQKLSFAEKDQITITKYVRKFSELEKSLGTSQDYQPYIRTILSGEYQPRRVLLEGFSEEYPWEVADNHLAAGGRELGEIVEQLRYWRARFVLLPVEPPAATKRTHQPEENEEEIHLLGIRALTQLWQRNKYVPPEERRTAQNRMSSFKKRDQNPLSIKMETLNPSELVATELDRMLQLEETSEIHTTQLLPEPDKLERSSKMQDFSQAMQSERGIEIKNRRWHLRLYYNCFHGEEFTNWLMHNVKGIDTRNEAVEFGNELMNEGLFEHVNGRHNFKDGHYFYSIKSDYRTLKLDLRTSWFPSSRQSNRSIPHTPSTEQPNQHTLPLTVRTRSASNLAQQLSSPASTDPSRSLPDIKRKVVSLSRVIKVDVDTRKKSFFGRQELVNVHYDRLHNPENCYHIELNWLSTTCKLVDDAILSWTNAAERYGLKLVEVPIAEACDVPLSEPFRRPYRIKLCVEPPKRSNTANSANSNNPTSGASNISFNNVFFTANSFGAQQTQSNNQNKNIYQKALLKKFNFVLDLEAASEFPENVDIQYSWGKLEYKYTQFVHRSGVILAQITDEGDILLLANRLYNSRLANTSMKDTTSKYDTKRDTGPQAHRPPVPPSNNFLSAGGTNMQASGIVGVNLASPNTALTALSGLTASPSPKMRPFAPPSSILSPGTAGINPPCPTTLGQGPGAVADSFGTRSALINSGLFNMYITPEQIKDDLEVFCSDPRLLETFFREVSIAASQPPPPPTGSRKAGSTSSSLLRPVRELPDGTAGDMGIPAFELPESITATTSHINAMAGRRATVAYENPTEMMSKESGIGNGVSAEFGDGRRRRDGSGGTIGSVGDAEMALAAVARSRHGSSGTGGIESPLRRAIG